MGCLNCDLWDWGDGHDSRDARDLSVSGMVGELGDGYEWGVGTVVCGIGVMDMIRGGRAA